LVQVVQVVLRSHLVEPMQAMADLPLFRAVELLRVLQLVEAAARTTLQLQRQVDRVVVAVLPIVRVAPEHHFKETLEAAALLTGMDQLEHFG
jgi:hypothetical protein